MLHLIGVMLLIYAAGAIVRNIVSSIDAAARQREYIRDRENAERMYRIINGEKP